MRIASCPGAGREAVTSVARGLIDAAMRRRSGKADRMVQRLPSPAAVATASPGQAEGEAPRGSRGAGGQQSDDAAGWGEGGVVSLSGDGAERARAHSLDKSGESATAQRWPPAPVTSGVSEAVQEVNDKPQGTGPWQQRGGVDRNAGDGGEGGSGGDLSLGPPQHGSAEADIASEDVAVLGSDAAAAMVVDEVDFFLSALPTY